MHSLNKAALEKFNPEKHYYLRVSNKGGVSHLVTEKKCWLGRLWMRIRGNNSNYSANKIASYVNAHFSDLSIKSLEELPLIDKLNHFLNAKPARLDTATFNNTFKASECLRIHLYQTRLNLLSSLHEMPRAINKDAFLIGIGLRREDDDIIEEENSEIVETRVQLILANIQPQHFAAEEVLKIAKIYRQILPSYYQALFKSG